MQKLDFFALKPKTQRTSQKNIGFFFPTNGMSHPMIGENRQLVTDEQVEIEK